MNSTANRRQFVKSAAATVAAPFILPSKIWSAETKPNSQLGIGFIGMGKMNGGHLGGFLGRDDVKVLGVAEVHKFRRDEAVEKINKKYGNTDAKGYNNFEELLARPDIDAVVIATPDHWHAICGIAAANGKKHIYGEKPLTHNITEALKLVKAVRDNGITFQTGSQQRSSAEFRIACEIVRNGVIGKVDRITTSFGDPAKPNAFPEQPMPEGLDWDRWCGPGPLVPYNEQLCERGKSEHFPAWRNTREFGGGMITDWGAHHIDIAQWGMGVDETGPVEVKAPADYANAKRGAQLVYANGVVLTHQEGFGVSFYGPDGEVHVNRGKFKVVLGGQTKYYYDSKDEAVKKATTLARETTKAKNDLLKDAKVKLYETKGSHHDDFIQAVHSGNRPICDVEVGATTVISCHLMNMGYWYGANIKWDPAKREFISGGDAKWLTREYRGNWKV
ncbi:MAG: Gfo/Idh/MocA family oxidoreductase [Verrucomicrobiaceae bacterium]|nr:Gfo/Idh/MocA family oxidoreductase [Verrucomicrobiaceae bacterium]